MTADNRRALTLSLLLLALFLAGAAVPDSWALATDYAVGESGPSLHHWLGTDRHGRDIAIRVLASAGNVGVPAIGAAAVATLLGVPIGAVAGWVGGPVARGVAFVLDALSAVPRYVLVILALATWGTDPAWLALFAGIGWTPPLADAVRQRVIALRDAEYVLASRLHGVPGPRLLWVHCVWHGGRAVIARQVLSLVGAFLVLEASLSYLGARGTADTLPTWGNLMRRHWSDDLDVRFLAPAVALLTAIALAQAAAAAIREAHDG